MTKKATALLYLVNGRPPSSCKTTHPRRSNELRSALVEALCAPIVSPICHAFAEPLGLRST
jgi:hypothetical protein